MKITNTQVFGLEGSIIASRYPMMTETPNEDDFAHLDKWLQTILMHEDKTLEELKEIYGNEFKEEQKFLERAKSLGRARSGSGHNNMLKGIIVQADITASQAWWLQQGRYHFSDVVSSQSKMHRLTIMDLDKQCNDWVDRKTIDALERWIERLNNFEIYKEEYKTMKLRSGKIVEFTKDNLFQVIINNCPMGLELTARITDNYLSVKTQYEQRKGHPLYDWADWSKWAEQLPCFRELTNLNIKGED